MTHEDLSDNGSRIATLTTWLQLTTEFYLHKLQPDLC